MRQRGPKCRAKTHLVDGIAERVQEADRHRVNAGSRNLVDDARDLGIGESRRDFALRGQPLLDFEAKLGRHQRMGPRQQVHAIEVAPRTAGNLDRVGKAGGRDQGAGTETVLDDIVRDDRRAVHDFGNLVPVQPNGGDRVDDRSDGLLRLARDLGRARGRPVGRNRDDVGEGAANVDSKSPAAHTHLRTNFHFSKLYSFFSNIQFSGDCVNRMICAPSTGSRGGLLEQVGTRKAGKSLPPASAARRWRSNGA